MFERFTDSARAAVALAQEEARALGHAHIGAEHLLLALARDGQSTAGAALGARGLSAAGLRAQLAAAGGELDAQALAMIGIDLDQVRRATEAAFGPGALDRAARGRAARLGHRPFTKRAKKVLELALREALRLGHRHIGSGHLLLGLVREGDGMATRLLVEAGTDLAALRSDVERRLAAEAA